jgi:hypothetical protein
MPRFRLGLYTGHHAGLNTTSRLAAIPRAVSIQVFDAGSRAPIGHPNGMKSSSPALTRQRLRWVIGQTGEQL